MIYHCDISLWSTGPSKPWSWISFPAVKTLMIRAMKRCPGPWPWGNIQVHLITHPTSRAVADLRDLTRSGQWDAVSTREGQRRDTRSPERSTGCRIIVTLVSSAFFSNNQREWNRPRGNKCVSIWQHVSPKAHKQLYPSNIESTPTWTPDKAVILSLKNKQVPYITWNLHRKESWQKILTIN